MANNDLSRVEEILRAGLNGEEYNKPPQSRVEYLLIELIKEIESGGGGTTVDYNTQVFNKPSINDKVVEGNLTSDDIDVSPEARVDGENLIFG